MGALLSQRVVPTSVLQTCKDLPFPRQARQQMHGQDLPEHTNCILAVDLKYVPRQATNEQEALRKHRSEHCGSSNIALAQAPQHNLRGH